MLDIYSSKIDRCYKLHFDIAKQRWQTRLKTPEEMCSSFKPMVETQANDKGVQIRIVGTEKWIPVSELFTPPQK